MIRNFFNNIKQNPKYKNTFIVFTYVFTIGLKVSHLAYNFIITSRIDLLLFDLISLIYFLVLISFILFVFLKFSKEFIQKYSDLLVFTGSFLFLLFWIPFGLDMTDEGKQMSTAWFMFQANIKHSYNMFKMGSWFINSLWLSIPGVPFLLWERLGGVLVMSVMTLFSFKILKMYKNNIYTFLISFILLFFIICRNHPETKIDHSNLPTLLAIISLFFMLKFIRPDKGFDFKGNIFYNITCSFFILISIFTRMPHILFLIFPVIFYLLSIKMYKINLKDFFKAALSFYLPIVLILITGFLVLSITGRINSGILSKILQKIAHEFNFFAQLKHINLEIIKDSEKLKALSYNLFLLKRYTRDFIYITILFFCFSIVFISGGLIYKVFNNLKISNKKTEFVFFILIGILLFFIMLLKSWMWYMAVYGFIFSYLVFLLVKKINLKNEFFYIFWGILLAIISFLGSNNSFRHSIPAGAVFVLFGLIPVFNYNNKKILIEKGLNFFYRFCIIFFIMIFFIAGYKKLFDNNKRDKMIFKINTMYSAPALFGVFSAEDRVKAVDGILDAVKKHTGKNDTLICFNSIPIIHYLSNRNYFLDDPWPNVLYDAEKKLERKTQDNQFPDFIVFSKKTAREPSWPDSSLIIRENDKEFYVFMVNYINENDFINIYENEAFILYKKD